MAGKVKQPGSIKHLGGTKYQAVLYVGRDVLRRERRVTKVFHAPTDTAAGKMSTDVFKALKDRAEQVQTRRGTIAELADDWMKAKIGRGSPSTVDGVRPHVESIKKHLGGFQVDDVTGEHVDAWLDQLRAEKTTRHGTKTPRKRSEATVHHYYATLRTMLRWARKKRRATLVATEFADSPTPLKYQVRPPTDEVMQLVLATAGGDFLVALELLAATGMRRGELVGLRWSDLTGTRLRIDRAVVELTGGGVHIKAPKSGEQRQISIAPATVEMLHAHHASLLARSAGLTPDAYMFPALRLAADGTEPHRPSWINLNWKRIKKSTGVQFRIHDVRHWHLSRLLLEGVPMAMVKDRAGHTTENTTRDIYSHVLDDNDDLAASTAQRALGRG